MANDGKKINTLGSDKDEDPTVELEVLTGAVSAEIEAANAVDEGSNGATVDFAGFDTDLGNADEAIAGLKSDLSSHAETIRALQIEIEQLRSTRAGPEKDFKVLQEAISNMTHQLSLAHKEQASANESLKARDEEIASLRAQLSSMQRSSVIKLLKERDKEIASLRSQLPSMKQTPVIESRAVHHNNEYATRAPELQPQQAITHQYEKDIAQLRKSRTPTASGRTAISAKTTRADTNGEPYDLAMLVPLNGIPSNSHPIRKGQLRLGSGPDNDIQINGDFISLYHAQIVSGSTGSVLGDLNSTNGTYVNSKRIKRYALRDGDSIAIGKQRFKYVKRYSGNSDYDAEIGGARSKK